MAKRTGNELILHDRVISNVDLPRVPKGTPGRVILKNGLTWIRYRVLFDTETLGGTDVGSLDRSTLERIDKRGNLIDSTEAK